jgi:hypothetical protein
MWCLPRVASAQSVSSGQAPERAAEVANPGLSGQGVAATEAQLQKTKHALERAHFAEASTLARELLATTDLPARLRNEAWELLAIAQIAARKEADAQASLRTLYQRDPDYPRQVADPGPAVDAAFARARQAVGPSLVVPMRYVVERDAEKRVRLAVDLTAERDAVESVHVFVAENNGTQLAHLVGQVDDDRPLAFVLPEPGAGARSLGLLVEAHAPSGAVLGRLGEKAAPLNMAVPPLVVPAPVCAPVKKPLRREWWIWTTLGLVVSGFVVASAVTAN